MKNVCRSGVLVHTVFWISLVVAFSVLADGDGRESGRTDELIEKDWSGILDMEVYYVVGLDSHPLRAGETGLITLRISNPSDDAAHLAFFLLYSKGGKDLFPEDNPPMASYYSQLLTGDASEYTGHGVALLSVKWFDEEGDLVKEQRTVTSRSVWIDAHDYRNQLVGCQAPDREGVFRLEVLLDNTRIAEGMNTYNMIFEEGVEVFRGTATAEGVVVKGPPKGK